MCAKVGEMYEMEMKRKKKKHLLNWKENKKIKKINARRTVSPTNRSVLLVRKYAVKKN